MKFVETSVFTRQIQQLLDDDEYHSLQLTLWLRPDQGSLIRGSGGLRKIRWRTAQGGKRGGIRTIYYWNRPGETIYFLFAYGKSSQENLTKEQLAMLSKIVREELK